MSSFDSLDIDPHDLMLSTLARAAARGTGGIAQIEEKYTSDSESTLGSFVVLRSKVLRDLYIIGFAALILAQDCQ